jgi:hypothetical protein
MSDAFPSVRGVRRRFRLEAALSVVCIALFVVTVVWPDWVELIFGVDPDDGDGALEWFLNVALLLASASTFALARRDQHRLQDLRMEAESLY